MGVGRIFPCSGKMDEFNGCSGKNAIFLQKYAFNMHTCVKIKGVYTFLIRTNVCVLKKILAVCTCNLKKGWHNRRCSRAERVAKLNV